MSKLKPVSKHTIVNSHNEWDPLQEVILGIADDMRYPNNDYGIKLDVSFEENNLTNLNKNIPKLPKKIIEETREDLEIFSKALTKMGISVKRPQVIDTTKTISNLFWKSDQFFNYCPRDIMTVIGNTIIESPCFYRSRYFETFSYRDIILEYFSNGSRWISAPKPRLRDMDYQNKPKSNCILNNQEPIFDAANILRAGKDIFYLVSNSGNSKGYDWLKSTLGENYRVHKFEGIYSGTHIDTTIILLRPGLVMVNPARISEKNMPPILKQWDILFSPEMEDRNYSTFPPFASSWLGINLLMINPSLAVVDADQVKLIKVLEKKRIDVLPLRLRHGKSLGGGFHCVTLDTIRKGKLESYFK